MVRLSNPLKDMHLNVCKDMCHNNEMMRILHEYAHFIFQYLSHCIHLWKAKLHQVL